MVARICEIYDFVKCVISIYFINIIFSYFQIKFDRPLKKISLYVKLSYFYVCLNTSFLIGCKEF